MHSIVLSYKIHTRFHCYNNQPAYLQLSKVDAYQSYGPLSITQKTIIAQYIYFIGHFYAEQCTILRKSGQPVTGTIGRLRAQWVTSLCKPRGLSRQFQLQVRHPNHRVIIDALYLQTKQKHALFAMCTCTGRLESFSFAKPILLSRA